MITAHYKGKRYLLDGTVGAPLENEGTIELWYKVNIERNSIMETLDTKESYVWPPVVCRMAPEARAAAAKIERGRVCQIDWHRIALSGRNAEQAGVRGLQI